MKYTYIAFLEMLGDLFLFVLSLVLYTLAIPLAPILLGFDLKGWKSVIPKDKKRLPFKDVYHLYVRQMIKSPLILRNIIWGISFVWIWGFPIMLMALAIAMFFSKLKKWYISLKKIPAISLAGILIFYNTYIFLA